MRSELHSSRVGNVREADTTARLKVLHAEQTHLTWSSHAPRVSASHLACVTEIHLAWIKMHLPCVSEIVIISGADFHSLRESIV
ncbi:hypothetical protein ACLB2K_072245 [Fragaria x ananassa]